MRIRWGTVIITGLLAWFIFPFVPTPYAFLGGNVVRQTNEQPVTREIQIPASNPSPSSVIVAPSNPVLPEKAVSARPTIRQDYLSEVEYQTFALINQLRIENGKPLLQWSEYYHTLAQEHSKYMAEMNEFEHSSVGVYENIFMSENVGIQELPGRTVQSWMNSPGHKANILELEIHSAAIGVWVDGRRNFVTYMAD